MATIALRRTQAEALNWFSDWEPVANAAVVVAVLNGFPRESARLDCGGGWIRLEVSWTNAQDGPLDNGEAGR